jgi:hypothetical protein
MNGEEVEVIGYFCFWDNDIPVLYATSSDYESKDGLYKSHIIFKDESKVPRKEMSGEICTFSATVWYRGAIPTLDQAALVECAE